MRRAFADFSPAVPAAFAAGLGVSLWIFLLPAGVVQKGPTPVLPALGGTAGRVVADLPVPARARASDVQKAVSVHSKFVIVLRPPAAKARPVHHQPRTGMVRRASPAPVREAPVTKSQLFSIPEKAKGKAHGHDRGNASEPKAETPTPHSPGHGKALGRSNEREDRLPPGQAKKASRASAPGLPPPRKGNGGGNGRKGKDGGNGGKDNGDGDGRRGEEK
ncbi:MAG TPA: hypothetical protein VF063_01875 [Gaiellaceae bacterium]